MKSNILFSIFGLLLFQCDFNYNNPVDPDVHLSSPGYLQLVQDGEWIRLSWDTFDIHSRGYEIFRKYGDEEWLNIINIENTKQSTYLDTSIQSNIVYQYKIRKFADDNKSRYSNIISLETRFPAPYDLKSISESENSVRLTWKDSCDFEQGFKIMRNVGQSWLIIDSVDNNKNYFVDEGLDYNSNYEYSVIGYTEKNVSLQSEINTGSVRLDAPSNLIYNPVSDHEIRLVWEDNSLFEKGFKVERRAGITDSWTEIATLAENQTTWIDSTVYSDKFYAYRVKAFSENYESEFSNQISAKTEFPAPTHLRANSINNYSAKISWSGNYSYETSYIFQYVVKDQTDTITIQLPVETNEYTLEDIYENNMYNIVVKARTELNVSKPLRGTIGFSDTFTWIDVPVLLGNKVNSIDFSTDGSVMILGREGNDCDIWNTDSWSLIQSVKGNISDESANVVDAVLAHDNPWLALGSLQGSVRILNNDGWSEIKKLNLNAYPLTSCQFSIDDSYLAVAQYKFIYLWNTSDWSFSSTLSEHTEQITNLDFSPNGNWLASGGTDDQIIIWSTDSWNDVQTLNDPTDDITDFCFSPNSQYLVSGSADGAIRIWSTNDWSESTLLSTEIGSIKAITFSNDGNWLAAASGESGIIKLWSTDGWTQFPGPTGVSKSVTSLKYTPDGTRLVAALADGSVSIWNLEGAWNLIED